MKIPLFFVLSGALYAMCGAHAQQIVPTTQTEQLETPPVQIAIKNVKPSMMAWWLDPANHEKPASKSDPTPPLGTKKESTLKSAFTLPAGIDRIVAVDTQNILLVFGTTEGVTRLANVIRFLDRPLRQVEIEAIFYQIAAEEVDKLGIDFKTTNGQPLVGRVQGNINEILGALVAQQKAKILLAPQVTAINNLTAQLGIEAKQPATWNVVPPHGGNKPFANQDAPLTVVRSQSWQITPTINDDGTIILRMSGEQKSELRGDQTTAGAIVLERKQTPSFILDLHAGETVAIEEQSLTEGSNMPPTKTIVLLTPRIVRKTGD